MAVWSVYANTHIAWCVDELTSVVTRLQQDGVKFFGPTRRADGVFQLYVELPYLHYIPLHYPTHSITQYITLMTLYRLVLPGLA